MVQLECCCTLVFKSGAASLVSVDRQKFAISFLDRTCCSERFSSFCEQISLFSSSMTEDKLQGESCSGFRTFPGFRVCKTERYGNSPFVCHWKLQPCITMSLCPSVQVYLYCTYRFTAVFLSKYV